MGDCPDYYTNISLILSRVMGDVGVNEESVLKRRKTNLIAENIMTLTDRLCDVNITRHLFGSQTEGTTTVDLNSDVDILDSYEDFNVIQDWKYWEHGKRNMLMLRDEGLYPGYCKLLRTYSDIPLPVSVHACRDGGADCIDRDGNVIYKDHGVEKRLPGYDRHGPAVTKTHPDLEVDYVIALRCETWPIHYKQWTPTNKRRDWPTPEMIQHMKSTGCFVVKASHRLDERNETWRISISHAERCLMFSLNITQIRCYVLLKIITKTFIQPHLPDTISSYMCKTLMFHAIENTKKDIWNEHNLLRCVHLVILYLLASVLDENCPNYFNESANLFLGKVDGRNKNKLMFILRCLLQSRGRFLIFIKLDNINDRLVTYLSCGNFMVPTEQMGMIKYKQCADILEPFLCSMIGFMQKIRMQFTVYTQDTIYLLVKIRNFVVRGRLQKDAVRLCLPFLCSFVATVDASKSFLQNTEIKQPTMRLFDLSLHSDLTSSRLKFASYLYRSGDKEGTLSVLNDVEGIMTDSLMVTCYCHDITYPPKFLEGEARQKFSTTDRLALCVMFSVAESQCCPRELQYEMLRSTDVERTNRVIANDDWMDLVVMDSLPYIYYLQYMTFRHLGQHDQQYTALNKLSDCVSLYPIYTGSVMFVNGNNGGTHRLTLDIVLTSGTTMSILRLKKNQVQLESITLERRTKLVKSERKTSIYDREIHEFVPRNHRILNIP